MAKQRESHWLTHPKRAPERASLALLSLLGVDTHPTDTEWMSRGLCSANPNPDFWFPGRGRYDTEAHAAVSVCHRCPVRGECLSYAVDLHQGGEGVQGIWAGTTPGQRDALAHRVAAS